MGPVIPSPHAPQPSALAKLSLRDKLLLAQAVHEIGTTPPDWGKVSALLLAHPLIRKQSRLEQAAHAGLTLGRIFGTRECERAWTALMRQRGLVLSREESGPEVPLTPQSASSASSNKPKEARGLQPRMDRKSQLALAQLLYAERMEELKEQIREKEQQFKNLVKEIDEIKSGQADVRLEMELRIEMENLAKGPPLPPTTPGGTVIGNAQAVTTPGGTMITPTKNPKIKGRARGESSATTPGTDLTKASPRSDYTGSSSNPNSASKKGDSAKSRKLSDRRASIGDQSMIDSPTKLVPGAVTSLPNTPSITLPLPGATASIPISTGGAAGTVPSMTTAEAEQAVASAAAKAAVTAIQNPTSAAGRMQELASKMAASETDIETPTSAEGSAIQNVSAGSNVAPAAEVVVKEKTPIVDVGEATSTDASQAAIVSAIDAATRDDRSSKRKRHDDETEPRSSQGETRASPSKKTRAAPHETSKDSEDEAEAVIDSTPRERDRRSSRSSQKGADEDEPEESTRSGRLGRRRSQAKTETTSSAKASSSKAGTNDTEAAADDDDDEHATRGDDALHEESKEEEEEEEEEEEAVTEDGGDEENESKRTTRGSMSRTTPARNRYNSASSIARARRGSRAGAASPAVAVKEEATTAVLSERDKAHRRKQTQVLLMLLTEVSNHTHGNLFHAPIKEQDAPDYYQLIKQPLDIKTIRSRIKEGAISSASQLRKSLNLMFANSLVYNRPGTEVHRMASEMLKASETIFSQYEGTRRF